ncbi:MAG: GAF domain-containing protein [Alsobacter sp.]
MSGPDSGRVAVDITNCDREPIHVPGSIQPHGVIVAVTLDSMRVAQVGGDSETLLGRPADDLLGRPIADWLTAEQCRRIGELVASGSLDRPSRAFVISGPPVQADMNAVVHVSDGILILELEPTGTDAGDDSIALVHGMVRHIQAAATHREACQAAASQVAAATGFDRVVVYRFLPDSSGLVEAEVCRKGMDSFLGLQFPASDIPKQARELYLRNWIRAIPDAKYSPFPIVPERNPVTGRQLDLTQSALRSVSPIHLEYLANMGVRASLSLSLILNGRLWGLIACHHETAKFVGHEQRMALETFAQMASYILETKLTSEELAARLKAVDLHDQMIASLSKEQDLTKGLRSNQSNLMNYIHSGGVCVWMDGNMIQVGATPNERQTSDLVNWLNTAVTDGVYHTDTLPYVYTPSIAFKDVASGILALSVSRTPRDYVIWFRPELVRTITWAGDPLKAVTQAEDGPKLSPRSSFAAWQAEMRLHAAPWTNVDLQTAQTLRVSLLEVVLLRIDEVAREKQAANARQEALLEELDKRIQQWEATARDLKREGDRRAVLEAELSEVLRRTVVEQESERQRIARELHDKLGQFLTIMQLDLDEIARRSTSADRVRDAVSRLKELTSTVGQEVNRLAWEIRPTSLDDLGLQTAVQQFTEEWSERSGLDFDLHVRMDDRRFPSSIETTLYRVIQEAVTNIVKHARASRVGIILEATGDEVSLIVEDNGQGFNWEDPDAARSPSARLGLLGIRERLALVGGRLEIESERGVGTTLIVHVPH